MSIPPTGYPTGRSAWIAATAASTGGSAGGSGSNGADATAHTGAVTSSDQAATPRGCRRVNPAAARHRRRDAGTRPATVARVRRHTVPGAFVTAPVCPAPAHPARRADPRPPRHAAMCY
ncbi:hypothetical protein GCM10009827_086030 [Dactylosporangium maewongense]|uniref:Uncharacterized protein n=1 Tax=Dactylosporangium maewongense TaxID=634393 RepID=A0ABP4MZ01_9ACTN